MCFFLLCVLLVLCVPRKGVCSCKQETQDERRRPVREQQKERAEAGDAAEKVQ